jgi:hypothetical protein
MSVSSASSLRLSDSQQAFSLVTLPAPQLRFRGRGSRRSYRVAMQLLLGPEVTQFTQRCDAWNSREQKHTRRAAHMDVRRAPPGQDVPCGACPRLLRTCGPLIQKKAFFFGYLLTEGNPDGLLSLLTKESNSAACGRKLLILPLASKALELQGFKALKL